MNNLSNSTHPSWCLRGPDCADSAGLHYSRLVGMARGNEIIQMNVGLWRMDVGPVSPGGVLLEFTLEEDVDRWPVDLAQSHALARLLPRLLRQADATLQASRAA
ncbi:hypothetical protein AB0J86_20285 [Micromonospora sp. NPDC049559]|uniref:hypothetical protein n=1 Tax=Micromonospora sp. NPDC049559 TaxID=3155923 RepID=UPI0034270D65